MKTSGNTIRIGIAAAIILGTIGWLAMTGYSSNKSYYVTIAELSGIAYGLVDIAYSTQEESEADRTGFLMMARTGYSPVEAITLFRAMQLALERPSEVTRPAGPLGELSTGLGAALQDYFRTHPSFADRIADLRQLLAENESSWRSKMFCVGTSNLRDLVTCMDERRDAEWVPVDASQLK